MDCNVFVTGRKTDLLRQADYGMFCSVQVEMVTAFSWVMACDSDVLTSIGITAFDNRPTGGNSQV